MNKIRGLVFTLVALLPVNAIGAQEDLGVILRNGGFEDADLADQWTATKKSTNYRLEAPELDPDIVPKGEDEPLEAPAGDRFIGVLNSGDDDINGRLVHDAVGCGSLPSTIASCTSSGLFRSGTEFTVTLFGNRGRLLGAPSTRFPSSPSELTLQFFGWKAGTVPFVDPSSDNWSRTPAVLLSQSFTKWAANGEWAFQVFKFKINQTLQYISLAVNAKNHNAASYVAFDILSPAED